MNNANIIPMAIGCYPDGVASYQLMLRRNALMLGVGLYDGEPVVHILEHDDQEKGYTYVWVIPAFLKFRDEYPVLTQERFIGTFEYQGRFYYVFGGTGDYRYDKDGVWNRGFCFRRIAPGHTTEETQG